MENDSTSHTPQGSPNALNNFKLPPDIPEGSYLERDFKSWIEDEKNGDVLLNSILDQNGQYKTNSNNDKDKALFISFQKAMKVLFITGQCLGLNPVSSILKYDILKIRFRLCSWQFIYAVLTAILQSIATGACFYKQLHSPVSIRTLTCLYLSTSSWCTIMIFIQIATRWENLVKELFNCNLDNYVDSGIVVWCNVYCIIFFILCFVERILYFSMMTLESLECSILDYNFYEKLMKNMHGSLFEIGIPYNIPNAVIIQINNLMAFMHWNFADICIICLSLYLTSILNEINRKILWAAEKNYLPSSTWGTLREDYSRATRLIRMFDDVFSSLTLISFATNLFSICLQIFNLLENGIQSKQKHVMEICPDYQSLPLHGYEYPVYKIFSLAFSIARFTAMCLAAASVNVASSVPASGLYRIPSCSYSMEVQRFLDQVHDDVVALSGMKYFYVTKGLLLSVAGTMLTYELVLLQFKSEELNDD